MSRIMENKFIPDDVAQFIVEKIDSVAELETLLLLRQGSGEKWTAQLVAKRLYLGEEEAFKLLVTLSTKGIVIHRAAVGSWYEYEPGSVELRQTINRVAEIYSKHIVPVTNLIHANPKTRVQEFADAFKLRKDD